VINCKVYTALCTRELETASCYVPVRLQLYSILLGHGQERGSYTTNRHTVTYSPLDYQRNPMAIAHSYCYRLLVLNLSKRKSPLTLSN